jgi:hypothetical protein
LYLAGQYAKRDILKVYADKLENIGIKVTSRWLMEDKPLNTKIGDDTEEFYRETAEVDLEDIDTADGILFFAEDPHVGIPRGGRHVEYGYALAKGRFMFSVGPKENIFHFLDRVGHYETFDEFFDYACKAMEISSGSTARR